MSKYFFLKSFQNLFIFYNFYLFSNGTEVAVTYFRCGYMPEHFPEQKVSFPFF